MDLLDGRDCPGPKNEPASGLNMPPRAISFKSLRVAASFIAGSDWVTTVSASRLWKLARHFERCAGVDPTIDPLNHPGGRSAYGSFFSLFGDQPESKIGASSAGLRRETPPGTTRISPPCSRRCRSRRTVISDTPSSWLNQLVVAKPSLRISAITRRSLWGLFVAKIV